MSAPDQSPAKCYALSDVRHDQAGFESLVRLFAALVDAMIAILKPPDPV